jgi:hypothetical protein
VEVKLHNSYLDGGQWSVSRPSRFTPGEIALGTHCIGGWVGPRAGLEAVEKRKKNLPPPRIRTPVIQYAALSYTDLDIPASTVWKKMSWRSFNLIIYNISSSVIKLQLVVKYEAWPLFYFVIDRCLSILL